MISKKIIFFIFLFIFSINIYIKLNKEKEINNTIETENIIIPDVLVLESPKIEINEQEKKKAKIKKMLQLKEIKKNFLKLKNKPINSSDLLIKKEKNKILLDYFNTTKINFDINIYYNLQLSFGNQLIGINNLIFICEIIGCRRIILPQDNRIYFQNKIYDKEYNLFIEVENETFQYKGHLFNLTDIDKDIYFHKLNFKVENRIGILRDEILKNLPELQLDENDLYIHIRSSDIFMNKDDPIYAPDYAQPPLCFYQKIIDNNNFNQIRVVSQDNSNPVVDELINRYNNIIYEEQYVDNDIAQLIYAYNIVGSISSFLTSIIKLNKNLKNFWEYDIYPISLKIPHLHHSLFNFKRDYTIYKMIPSKEYKNQMLIWECSEVQINLMKTENCINNFIIIKPNTFK